MRIISIDFEKESQRETLPRTRQSGTSCVALKVTRQFCDEKIFTGDASLLSLSEKLWLPYALFLPKALQHHNGFESISYSFTRNSRNKIK
jgi:hypothetical protein